MKTRNALLGSFLAALAGCHPSDPIASAAEPPASPPWVMVAEPPPPPPAPPSEQPGDEQWGIVGDRSYPAVVEKVTRMVEDAELRASVERRGLSLVNVMWEDTGRYQQSAVGPNITDLTLAVGFREGPGGPERNALLPVIRFPNFTDRTGDVPADRFLVRMGNHRSHAGLATVPLTEVLGNIRRFASQPGSIRGPGHLLARRDTHFLVSAQAVFLPIQRQGKTEYHPVVYNYQSEPGAPAVLVLLVTRQGTSMTVVENTPEQGSQYWGQELYFNNGGQRASYTAERRSDVAARIEAQGGPRSEDDRSALARGADNLFLIQVPLKHPERRVSMPMPTAAAAAPAGGAPAAAPQKSSAYDASEAERSDVEQAVLGHGRDRGPYNEGRGLWIERDPRFPIRITVQFYKATSNGVVDESDLDAIARTLGSVYEHAEFVGSLVIPDGDPRRPTEWQRISPTWFPW